MQIMCECNWEIPRVEKLPPHLHVILHHMVSPTYDMWIPNILPGDGYEIVDQREEIRIPVDWKAYNRTMEAMPKRKPSRDVGVGSPAHLKLEHWGYLLRCAFGEHPYLVGSATEGKHWRDVDVRMIFDDDKWERWIGRIESGHRFIATWNILCTAISVWGREFTGLPIDFQFQRRDEVTDADWAKIREPLGGGFYGISIFTKEDRERDPDYRVIAAAEALAERWACAHEFDSECALCETMTPLRKALKDV